MWAATIEVNSLHHQGIDRLAPGLAVEATAPDGTIEAVRLMLSEKLDCLPVVKDGELVGLVSTQDMLVVLACLLGADGEKTLATGAGL